MCETTVFVLKIQIIQFQYLSRNRSRICHKKYLILSYVLKVKNNVINLLKHVLHYMICVRIENTTLSRFDHRKIPASVLSVEFI